MKRCDWVGAEQIYIDYHDNEWGIPSYNDQHLFEMLLLEGAQAGLSWIIILKRRENYRKAYDQFNAEKMARWSDKKIQALQLDSGIIRNKLKIQAAKTNAQAYLQIRDQESSFADYLWKFVNGKVINNPVTSLKDIPVTSKESDAMAKDLKKRGFKFVGSTICYAYMQATGMINDHQMDCFAK